MKKHLLALAVVVLATISGAAAQCATNHAPANLQTVYALLDCSSEHFKNLQAEFVWDQYQAVVNDHEIQRGTIYFQRAGKNIQVAAEINPQRPNHQKLLFKSNDLEIYSYRTRQTNRYPAGKNRSQMESYFALGFGGNSRELQRNFEVRYAGIESIDGRPAYKIELTPKISAVRNMFRSFILWIDQQTGMSVQQQAFEGKTDYRLAKYPFATMRLNQKLPEVFKLP